MRSDDPRVVEACTDLSLKMLDVLTPMCAERGDAVMFQAILSNVAYLAALTLAYQEDESIPANLDILRAETLRLIEGIRSGAIPGLPVVADVAGHG